MQNSEKRSFGKQTVAECWRFCLKKIHVVRNIFIIYLFLKIIKCRICDISAVHTFSQIILQVLLQLLRKGTFCCSLNIRIDALCVEIELRLLAKMYELPTQCSPFSQFCSNLEATPTFVAFRCSVCFDIQLNTCLEMQENKLKTTRLFKW